MASLLSLFTAKPGTILLAGLVLGSCISALLAVIFGGRSKRRELVLSLRQEQALKNIQLLETERAALLEERNELVARHRELEKENIGLHSSLRSARQQLGERDQLLETFRLQMEERFALLAERIFQHQHDELGKQQAGRLTALLSPFREQLKDFRQRVDTVYDRESRDRAALRHEIGQLKMLNERIGKDALELTDALKGSNKTAGLWGEMLLEKLLEDSGLRKGSEFELQPSYRTASGRLLQPDAVVHLPEARHILIDAKVSLKSYVQAYAENDAQLREPLMRLHLESVRRHVKGLAAKRYHQLNGLDGLDFVVLFIPVENAFQDALRLDPNLLEEAMRQKVILSSPSTLLAILRTIHHLWRLDEQNRNGLIIAKKAGNLYDKFVGFAEAFEEIGSRLQQTQHAWHLAKSRLTTGKGNLLTRAEELRALGVDPTKELPQSLKDRG
ncbi:MAG: DNA recombination protein RmuC [Desulfobulbus propionicus]|nr:MAG: DNA recombination protein RmuC [Desulfobulbus propionicus]